MKRKDLTALTEIAVMIRDREMAELAKLNLQRLRLETERQRVVQETKSAWRDGTESVMLSRAAENFAKWATSKQSQISEHLANLRPLIDAQKQRTAAATGRHRNLQEIARQLLEEHRKAEDKKT